MQGKIVTVFGGSGFIGRYLVQALSKEGARVRVAVRSPQKAEYLRPRGNVGDIMPVYANILDPLTVGAACIDADYVVNLVGILYQTRSQTFESVHVRGAANVAEAARRHKVQRLIHISALGADPYSDSTYAATKGKGEKAVFSHFEAATILRPSVVFGKDDKFINRFASMATFSPFLPAFGGGKNKMQPVYVCDVTQAIVQCLLSPSTKGQIFELGGPKVYTFKELLQLILKYTGRQKPILTVPYWVGRAMGAFTQILMPSVLTADQVRLLKQDNIVNPDANNFSQIQIAPESLEAILKEDLARYKKQV